MPTDAKVVVDMYELVKATLPAIGRFPKTHRFTVGERLETRLLDVLELLEQARFGDRRAEALRDADRKLQSVSTLLRLACDLQFVSQGQYGELSERLVNVGRQIGGWRKQVAGKKGSDGTL